MCGRGGGGFEAGEFDGLTQLRGNRLLTEDGYARGETRADSGGVSGG